LRGIGIQPEILLLRSDHTIDEEVKKKISLFCNVPTEAVINCIDVPTTYEVPLALWKEGLDDIISERLNIWSRSAQLSKWEKIVADFKSSSEPIDIGIVGKYVDLVESYKSINEALVHAGIEHQKRIHLVHVDSEEIETQGAEHFLSQLDAVLVPGGFGERGTEGKIEAVHYARTQNIPYFGICLGLQIAVIEYARNVAGLKEAASEEFAPQSKQNVIHIMEHQKGVTHKGASMRLGGYPCMLEQGSLAHKIYNKNEIRERHRHRFEVNNTFKVPLQKAGMTFSGLSPDGELVEIIELKDHPFFFACQFHPEFLSRPWAAHPIFSSFVQAAIKRRSTKDA
jgi:CTP synthase